MPQDSPNAQPSVLAHRYQVALVEDQPEMRETWSQLIGSLAGFSCVCTCSSAEEALRQLNSELRAEVVKQTAEIRAGYETAKAERQRL